MSEERPYVISNDLERERLATLVESLSDEELRRPLDHGGWTVYTALAHLAFWDRRALEAIEECERTGSASAAPLVDEINAEMLRAWLETEPRWAAEEAVAAAEAVDRKVRELPLAVAEAMTAAGRPRLDRGIHRREHLPQIECTRTGELR